MQRKNSAACLLLLVLAFALYGQTAHYDFINFDDNLDLSENPRISPGVTLAGLRWSFSADLFTDDPRANYWMPLNYCSHMLAAQIFGLNSGAHHLLNALLHGCNAALFYLLLLAAFGADARRKALLAAALFCAHPLHVESVAWIAERKDVLSMFFALLALHAYIAYCRRGGAAMLALTAGLYACALLSKPLLVMLPLLLLILDWHPLGRLNRAAIRRCLREKIPLFLLALVFGGLMLHAHLRTGATASIAQLGPAARAQLALVNYAVYLTQFVWPAGLCIYYPLHFSIPLWQTAASAALLTAISFAALRLRRDLPWLLAGWLWFLLALLPVSGVMQTSNQQVADRLVYLPSLGLYLAFSWGLAQLCRNRLQFALIGAVIVAPLGGLTFRQARYWQNSATVFQRALDCDEANFLAHQFLGNYFNGIDKLADGERHLRRSLELQAGNPDAQNELGRNLILQRKFAEALPWLQAAARIAPENPLYHYNAGTALLELNQLEQAERELSAALALDDRFAEAQGNLGLLANKQGKTAEALIALQRAVEMKPDDPRLIINLAGLQAKLGQLEPARALLQRALALDPADALDARGKLKQLESMKPHAGEK